MAETDDPFMIPLCKVDEKHTYTSVSLLGQCWSGEILSWGMSCVKTLYDIHNALCYRWDSDTYLS